MIYLQSIQITYRGKKAGMRIHEKFKQRNEPQMTRIYTDGESAGRRPEFRAGAAFSNPSTSKLARECANTSPTRSASGPALALATRPSTPSDTGLRLACQSGRCFGKASASSLGSVFTKHLGYSRNESTLGFLGSQSISSLSAVKNF